MRDMSTYSKQDDSNPEESMSHKKSKNSFKKINKDPLICNHCGRSSNNGIRCLGKCVADSDY